MTQQAKDGSLPLLCRSELFPGESLLSLLTRLVGLNSYGSIHMLSRWCLGGTQENIGRPWQAATFDRIVSLTKLSWEAVYDATPHRFAPILAQPGAQLEMLDFPSGKMVSLLPPDVPYEQLRSSLAGQFCPRCLEESAYHHVAWLPMAVSACLSHNCLLLDRCPDCWQPVTIQDIADACCSRCKSDLTQALSRSIEADTWGQFSQQTIQAWLGIAPMPAEGSAYSLPRESPAMLYHILDGLRRSITGVRAGWKYLYQIPDAPQYRLLGPDDTIPYREAESVGLVFDRTPSPAESYCLYSTAMKGMVNWPEGFHEFLRAYSLRDVVQLSSKLSADLGDLYSQWLAKEWQQVPLVQEAFNQYLVDHYALSPSGPDAGGSQGNREAVAGASYVTVSDAARLLDTSPKTIHRLVEVRLLFQYEFPECCELPGTLEEVRRDFVRRAEVLELRDRWAKGIPLPEAARWLGLSESVALDLVKAGLLFPEHGPDVDGSAAWVFGKQAMTECYYEITKHARRYGPDVAAIDLGKVARMLSGLGLGEARILEYVARGKVKCYLPKNVGGLDRMLFTEGDVRAFLEGLKGEKGWMDHKEVAHQMRVNITTVARWVKSELLSPVVACGRSYFFEPAVAEKFIAGHIFIEEAARRAGVEVGVIEEWVRKGLLRPISGPKVDWYYRDLFRREDIDRLCRAKQSGQVSETGA